MSLRSGTCGRAVAGRVRSPGDTLCERLRSAGHQLADRKVLPDDIFDIRAAVSVWIAEPNIDCILITGGSGITGRDSTPEAIRPLLVREIPDFDELFRQLSLEVSMIFGAFQ